MSKQLSQRGNFSNGINAIWHKANRMPKNPTFEERVTWHKEHQKNCNCWPIPSKLLKEIEDKNRTRKV